MYQYKRWASNNPRCSKALILRWSRIEEGQKEMGDLTELYNQDYEYNRIVNQDTVSQQFQ